MADENLNTGGTTEGTGTQQQAGETGATQTPASDAATSESAKTPEQQSQQQDSGEGGKSEEGKQQAPESYELALPEGSKLGDQALESITAYAKAHGLSQEAASQALDLANTQVDSFVEARQAEWQKQVHETWPEELRSDPDFGGEHFEANADKARQVLEKFGPPGFKDQLNESGFGNNPSLLKWALNVAKAMGEDELVTERKGGGERSQAEKLFGGS